VQPGRNEAAVNRMLAALLAAVSGRARSRSPLSSQDKAGLSLSPTSFSILVDNLGYGELGGIIGGGMERRVGDADAAHRQARRRSD
jgi:hypothetical protein